MLYSAILAQGAKKIIFTACHLGKLKQIRGEASRTQSFTESLITTNLGEEYYAIGQVTYYNGTSI